MALAGSRVSLSSALPKPKRTNRDTYSIGRAPEFEAIELNAQPEQPISRDVWVRQHQNFTRNRDSTEPKVTVTCTESLPGTGFYAKWDSTRWVVHSCSSDGGA